MAAAVGWAWASAGAAGPVDATLRIIIYDILYRKHTAIAAAAVMWASPPGPSGPSTRHYINSFIS